MATTQITTSAHLRGPLLPSMRFYPDGVESERTPYASVSFAGITLFINQPGQAAELAAIFAQVDQLMPAMPDADQAKADIEAAQS